MHAHSFCESDKLIKFHAIKSSIFTLRMANLHEIIKKNREKIYCCVLMPIDPRLFAVPAECLIQEIVWTEARKFIIDIFASLIN